MCCLCWLCLSGFFDFCVFVARCRNCAHCCPMLNITSAWAVDREFVNIYWAQLGPNFIQLGSNWIQIGSNWVPIGLHLDPFGSHWPLWGPIGCQARFGNLASSEVRSGRTTCTFLEFVAEKPEMVSRRTARSPPPTRAGGQDDGSYTNSLKILYTYIVYI